MHKEKLNSYNFFDIRKADYPPPWYEYIKIPMKYNLEKSIIDWIEDKLNGRFYVGKTINESNTIGLKIGFEDAKELSYFTLACPHLKYT